MGVSWTRYYPMEDNLFYGYSTLACLEVQNKGLGGVRGGFLVVDALDLLYLYHLQYLPKKIIG